MLLCPPVTVLMVLSVLGHELLDWLDRIGGEPPEPPTSNGVQVRHE